MVDINNVFPNAGVFRTREEVIEERLKVCKGLFDCFNSIEDVKDFLGQINGVDEAENFLKISRFYNIEKNYSDHPFLKFIMIISSWEAVSKKKHHPFSEWLEMNDNEEKIRESLNKNEINNYDDFREVISNLKKKYLEEYGIRRNIREFLSNNLTKEEKIEIIKSIIVMENSNNNLPNCFDSDRCRKSRAECDPGRGCYLKDNEEKLNSEFIDKLDIIYRYRSKFVHSARSPPFLEEPSEFDEEENVESVNLGTIDVFEGKAIDINLKTDNLEDIFEKSIIRYFKNEDN